MTPQQYERWKDFALRMASTCYRKARRPDAKWIQEVVQGFFDRLDEEDIPCIVSWDDSTGGRPCAGDMMTMFLHDYEPGAPRCKACVDGADSECRCKEIEHLFYEQWDEQWGGPVHCCVRAGLDCASELSAGVLGFTAGDVRRMYPEGVPDWVFKPNARLHYWPSNEVNGTFAELPDSMGVVL